MMKNLLMMTVPAFFIFGIVSAVSAAVQSGDSKLNQAIQKANSDWATAMKTGDAATIAAPYAQDAIFIGVDGTCTKGREEIEKLYITRFQKAGLAVSTKIEDRAITLDGDFAYESGYGEIGIQKDGKTVVNGGRFLTVWQRISGEWKIVRNIVLP